MARVVVLHTTYGCDTGCCGHVIQIDGVEKFRTFDFGHPSLCGVTDKADRDRIAREYAEDMVRHELGEDHIKDLDWDGCQIYDD